jgi:AraC-like DNA-binding protein
MEIINQQFYSNSLDAALRDKPNISLDLINSDDLPWQIIFSYTYSLRGYSSPTLHTQNYYEIIVYIKSGRKYFYRNSVFEAQYGDCILFSAGEPHKGIDTLDEPYERYYIYINPNLLDYLPDGKQYAELFSPERPFLIRFDPKLRDSLISRLTSYNNLKSIGRIEKMRLRILIYDLLCELSVRHDPVPHNEEMPPLLAEIIKYIKSNFASIATSSYIAAHFGISESYLSRLFKNTLDISPYQYLQQVRIFEAMRLLQSGAGVTEACFASGFTDCSHFITYFKRAVGVTPSVFKTNNKIQKGL